MHEDDVIVVDDSSEEEKTSATTANVKRSYNYVDWSESSYCSESEAEEDSDYDYNKRYAKIKKTKKHGKRGRPRKTTTTPVPPKPMKNQKKPVMVPSTASNGFMADVPLPPIDKKTRNFIDGISLSDIQAQEREFARLKSLYGGKRNQTPSKSTKAVIQRTPEDVKSKNPSKVCKKTVYASPNADKKRKMDEEEEDEEEVVMKQKEVVIHRRSARSLADSFSVSELQAQERELKLLRAQKKHRTDEISTREIKEPKAPTPKQPEAPAKPKVPTPGKSEAQTPEQPKASASAPALVQPNVSAPAPAPKKPVEPVPKKPEVPVPVKPEAPMPVKPVETKRSPPSTPMPMTVKAPALAPTPPPTTQDCSASESPEVVVIEEPVVKKPVAKPPPSSSSTRATRTNTRSSRVVSKSPRAPSPAPESKPNAKLMDPIVHATVWRNVCLDTAPKNIIKSNGNLDPPFYSSLDRPLGSFDPSGQLEDKAKLVVSFGKTKQFVSTLFDDETDPVSQEETNERVKQVYDRELPSIRSCFKRKINAIVAEGRAKLAGYRAAYTSCGQTTDRVGFAQQHVQPLPPKDPLHQQLATTLKRTKQVTGAKKKKIKYLVFDTSDRELQQTPLDVRELMKIQPLSRSTACVGLKSTVRVEDDPILRYVPYFGDHDDGRDIDIKQYDRIKAKEFGNASALDDEVHEYVLRVVVAECGDSAAVLDAVKTVIGLSQPYTDYCEIKKLNDRRRVAAQRIEEVKQLIKATAEEEPAASATILKKLVVKNQLFSATAYKDKPLSERLTPAPTSFEANTLREATATTRLGLRQTNDYNEMAETYRDLFCRMCYKYDCHEHGIEHPLPTRRSDPINPVVRLAPVIAQDDDSVETITIDGEESTKTEKDEAKKEEETTSGEGNKEEAMTDDAQKKKEDEASEANAIVLEPLSDKEDEQQEENQMEQMLQGRRRSARSQTRASTLATVHLEMQGIRQDRNRTTRAPRPKTPPQRKESMVESEYIDDTHVPLVSTEMKKFVSKDQLCGPNCWKQQPKEPEAEATVEKPSLLKTLSPTEALLVQKIRLTLGDNPCVIASILQYVTCQQLQECFEDERKGQNQLVAHCLSPGFHGKQKARKRGRASVNFRGGSNRELLKRTRTQRLKEKGSNHEYEPCNHDGVCDSSGCSCMTRDHTCEKACSCSRDCPNRFQGCRCSMGNCRTNACPCFVALRECNPDVCFSCGASEIPALLYDADRRVMQSTDLGICCNVNIQRGLHKKIGVSFSTTHGWGAFALEDIKKGEFIYEYTGAMISQDEAERRGSIYDKHAISFLFDLNEDAVVDAIRRGNKSKFANHSATGQKCKAKILRVCGEHRIAIWAHQDIRTGEELFFDYGYQGESAPDWSQVRIRSSSSSSSSAKSKRS